MADKADALTALLRQLEAAHKANMEEIKGREEQGDGRSQENGDRGA